MALAADHVIVGAEGGRSGRIGSQPRDDTRHSLESDNGEGRTVLDMKGQCVPYCQGEFESGDVVNLGIGLPVKVAYFLPRRMEVTSFESENGFLGIATGSAITNPIGPVWMLEANIPLSARRLFL